MPDGVWGPVSALKEGEAEVNPFVLCRGPCVVLLGEATDKMISEQHLEVSREFFRW